MVSRGQVNKRDAYLLAADELTDRFPEAAAWLQGRASRFAAEASDGEENEVRWADLFGSAPDFTGGRDVGEFLDKQRGEA